MNHTSFWVHAAGEALWDEVMFCATAEIAAREWARDQDADGGPLYVEVRTNTQHEHGEPGERWRLTPRVEWSATRGEP